VLAVVPAIAFCQGPPPDAREIVRQAIAADRKEAELARQYTFIQRNDEADLDGAGKIVKRQVRTYDVTLLEGSPYRRLLAVNDKPISEAEQKLEEQKLQASIEQRRNETPVERERRIEEWRRKQEKQREPVRELLDAFEFRLAGEETLAGGETYVIDATPKRGYKPKSTATSFFPKVVLRLWIDKAGHQWVKLTMDVRDTVTFGGFLLRVAKGGHLTIEQTRVNSEVWLPKRATLNASARLLLVKGYHKNIDVTFSGYRKFQVESRVVSTEADRER